MLASIYTKRVISLDTAGDLFFPLAGLADGFLYPLHCALTRIFGNTTVKTFEVSVQRKIVHVPLNFESQEGTRLQKILAVAFAILFFIPVLFGTILKIVSFISPTLRKALKLIDEKSEYNKLGKDKTIPESLHTNTCQVLKNISEKPAESRIIQSIHPDIQKRVIFTFLSWKEMAALSRVSTNWYGASEQFFKDISNKLRLKNGSHETSRTHIFRNIGLEMKDAYSPEVIDFFKLGNINVENLPWCNPETKDEEVQHAIFQYLCHPEFSNHTRVNSIVVKYFYCIKGEKDTAKKEKMQLGIFYLDQEKVNHQRYISAGVTAPNQKRFNILRHNSKFAEKTIDLAYTIDGDSFGCKPRYLFYTPRDFNWYKPNASAFRDQWNAKFLSGASCGKMSFENSIPVEKPDLITFQLWNSELQKKYEMQLVNLD